MGYYVNRPIYVFSGLAKQHVILGMDFVREQQLCIEADHVFFRKIPLEESVFNSGASIVFGVLLYT